MTLEVRQKKLIYILIDADLFGSVTIFDWHKPQPGTGAILLAR